MKVIIFVIAFISLSLAHLGPNIREEFNSFKTKYNKNYATESENESRFLIFRENLIKSVQLNIENPKARFGINKFSDLSESEFNGKYLMNFDASNYKAPKAKTDFTGVNKLKSCNPDPTNYDWDSCGVITGIYNQGQCGSCWAFSATETIESYWALAGNTLTSFSVEQIVSCDTNGQDQGCNGGFPSGAYSYVESAGGIEPENDYPYSAESGEAGSCNFNSGDVVATVTGYSSINGETGLYQQTSSSSGGPVSVCVDAASWQNYNGGVLTSCGTSVDHCVQLVGYANYGQSGAYWIVRNSWGQDWGENGFIWIEIGQDLCSIGDYATVVTATTA